ncbi:MAG: NAD(P)-binding protein, partial [Pirellulaceae bacterium]|nr:NAD(P)-binding protein [Pirellulaceae bacterium]
MDGVILGSGHNSLVLQAYLARAGQETICLERLDEIGGGLTTIEHPAESGFQHNTHAFFHRGVTQMPWYADLELERRGAQYITPDLNVALLASDGRSLEWWADFDRTVDSIAQVHAGDAATLKKWRDRFRSIVRDILIPEAQSPPLPIDERQQQLQQTEDGRYLMEVSKATPLEFVKENFQHPLVQAGLLFFNGLREVDLRCPGFGHHIPALLASD